MRKLADISAFESLQNQSFTVSDMSVFNGEFTEDAIQRTKEDNNAGYGWRHMSEHQMLRALGIHLGDAIVNGKDTSQMSFKELFNFVESECADLLRAAGKSGLFGKDWLSHSDTTSMVMKALEEIAYTGNYREDEQYKMSSGYFDKQVNATVKG